MSLEPQELEALLRLSCVPGVGGATLHRLLALHGSAAAVLALPWSALGEHGHERDSRRSHGRVRRALRAIEELQLHVLHIGAADYPQLLTQLKQPPVLLFLRGERALLGSGGVAVVGTRSPTEYGLGVAEMLAAGIARAGLPVWSGLARGIDASAHRAALDAAGATVAVLGCGIDVAYPPEHEALAERIATAGLLVSEYVPGEPPLPHHFPQRNRLIACLTSAVLVIEAREDGGALITADQANELGRTVLAVPGPVGRPTSYGPNRLIQDGAKLVIEVADVLEELGFGLNAAAARGRPSARRRWTQGTSGGRRPAAPPRTGDESAAVAPPAPVAARYRPVWSALGEESRHVDEVAAACAQSVAGVLGLLLELELDGRVVQLGGGRFRRAA